MSEGSFGRLKDAAKQLGEKTNEIDFKVELQKQLVKLNETLGQREIKDKTILDFIEKIKQQVSSVSSQGEDFDFLIEQIDLLKEIVDNKIDDFSELEADIREYLDQNCPGGEGHTPKHTI